MLSNFFNFFDIMNTFGVASPSKLIQQEAILNWLQQLSINEIKSIIEIKNVDSKLLVEKLMRNSKYKKQQVLKMGFFENSKNEIYYRTEFRYKKDKQKKKLVSQQLYQNLTISRRDECALNISKEYLETGKLKQAMMTLSDGENQSLWFRRKDCHSFSEWVTFFFQIEIAEAFNKKKVFSINPYNFVSDYTSDQLQAQLKKSIISVLSKNQKSIPNTNQAALKQKMEQQKKYMFGKCWDRIQADGRLFICEYTWLAQDRDGPIASIMDQMYDSIYTRFANFMLEQQIKEIQKYEQDLNKSTQKKKKKKNKKKGPQSKDQTIQKAEQSDFENQKAQTITKNSSPKQKIQNFIKKPEQQIERNGIDIQELQLTVSEENTKDKDSPQNALSSSQKNSNSYLNSSNKQRNQELTDEQDILIEQTNTEKSSKKQQPKSIQGSATDQKSDSFTDSTCKIDNISQKKVQESDQKSLSKQQERHTTKTKQYEQYYAHDKTSQMSQESQLSADCLKFKPKSKSLSKPSIIGVSMKKIDRKMQQQSKKQKQIENFLGSALENHAKYLIQESEKFQQTRKAAVDLIRQFFQKQQFKCKWELAIFGSCEVGYALKQSDIDLVLRIEDQKAYSLKQMQEDLKCWPWVLDFKYVYFQYVSLMKMKVNLYQAKRLSNRLLKKLDKCIAQNEDILQFEQQFVVRMDISICGLKEQYGGTVATNNLRFLFYENQQLRKLVYILKDLLHRKKLNRTYYGGINSYTLAILVYGVIKKKELQLIKNTKTENQYVLKKKKDYLQGLKSNLYIAFREIVNFLRDFVPFQTIINPLEDKIQPQKTPLNIVDPFSGKLLRTNASRIYDIIDQFVRFQDFLEERKQEIKAIDLEGNKKIKNEIEKKIAQYMADLEPALQVQKDL